MITITKEEAKKLGNIHREGLIMTAATVMGKCGIDTDDKAMRKAVDLFLSARNVEDQYDVHLREQHEAQAKAQKVKHPFERESLGSDRCKACGDWEEAHGRHFPVETPPHPEPTSALDPLRMDGPPLSTKITKT